MFAMENCLAFPMVELDPKYLCGLGLELKDITETSSFFFVENHVAMDCEDLLAACKVVRLVTFPNLRPLSMASHNMINSKNFCPIIGNILS